MLRGAPAGEAASPTRRLMRSAAVRRKVSGIPTQKSIARIRFRFKVASAPFSPTTLRMSKSWGCRPE